MIKYEKFMENTAASLKEQGFDLSQIKVRCEWWYLRFVQFFPHCRSLKTQQNHLKTLIKLGFVEREGLVFNFSPESLRRWGD